MNPVFASASRAVEVHKKIAANVLSLLKDRDCLQIGIGAVPGQISKLIANSDLKDLGIHTEMAPRAPTCLSRRALSIVNIKLLILIRLSRPSRWRPGAYDFLGNNPWWSSTVLHIPTPYLAVPGEEPGGHKRLC